MIDPRHPRIQIDLAICGGKPVIAGTRVPVAIAIGSLASGMDMDEVAHEYGLSLDELRAALAYASERLGDESVHPLPSRAA